MKIIVHPLLPTGNFLNCRIGVEKDYPDDYSLEQAINTEWDNLISIHMKRYPHLYNEKGEPLYEKIPQGDEMRGSSVRTVEQEPKIDSVQAVLDEIEKCTEMEGDNGLKSLWLASKGNLILSKAYKDKEKQLINL